MSHFPVSYLLLLTGSYPCHLLQSADCASLKKYMALLGCVIAEHWWEGIETGTIQAKQNPYS